ncbi:MAG: (Fe-S)-binding protein [Syntrophaceae bacterium]
MFHSEKCDFCGKCLEFCPYVKYDHDRAVAEMKSLVAGGNPPVVKSCVTCAACNQACPTGANPFDLLNDRQEQTGDLGIPAVALENFSKLHNLPTVIKQGEPGRPVMNLCIVGDMVREQLGNPLFKGLTTIEGADYFCTVGYVHLGKPSLLKAQAKKYVEKLAALKAEEIVCFHDDCYTMLTTLADEFGIEVPFRPVHLFEFLYKELLARQDVQKLSLKIAYQAPCASRYTAGKDKYLDLLLDVLGVERVPRHYDRLNGLCCGAPLMARDKDMAVKVKNWNIDDAKKFGADAMVFLCPMCYLNLRKLCRDNGIEPLFISELCCRAIAA